MAPSGGAGRPASPAVAVRRRAQPRGRLLPRPAGAAAGDRAGGTGTAPVRRRRRPHARVVGRRGRPVLAAAGPPAGDRRDLLPGVLGRRSGGYPGHTGRDREIPDVLRIEGAQAGAAGARTGAMTPTWDCTEARPSLGVYVLGAIDPAERSLVDAHLMTCRDCRDELAGLAGLPALLARVNPDEISRITSEDTVRAGTDDRPPGELIGTVLDLAAVRRRRTRWRFAAAAAAVVAIAGGLFGGLSSITTTRTVAIPVSPGDTHWETVEATSAVTGASASVAYSHELGGDAFEVLVDHIPVGMTCQLWVVHPNGTRTQVAAWTTAGDEGNVWYAGSMPSTSAPISSFQITADKKVLLTARPT